jgi:hypothetical protein
MLHWVLAFLITVGAAYVQRRTGPTYPMTVDAALGGKTVSIVLHRSHGGSGDQPVVVEEADPGITGRIAWRRYPTRDAFQTIPMRREGDRLVGALPHQPPAGKIQYRLELSDGVRSVRVPERGNVVTRFKGDVPALALVPHILFMFAAMLVSNAAGIEALRRGPRVRPLARWTVGLLLLGGFVFGPLVQKYAFGNLWTGVPFGYDLTDNKTLVALVAWLVALWSLRKGRSARAVVIAAAVVMFVIFLVPHSLLGSEIRYEAP